MAFHFVEPGSHLHVGDVSPTVKSTSAPVRVHWGHREMLRGAALAPGTRPAERPPRGTDRQQQAAPEGLRETCSRAEGLRGHAGLCPTRMALTPA